MAQIGLGEGGNVGQRRRRARWRRSPREVGDHRVGVQRGEGREECGSEGREPEGWGAQSFPFFPSPGPFSLFFPSWGAGGRWRRGLLVELLSRIAAIDHPKCAFGFLWGHVVRVQLRGVQGTEGGPTEGGPAEGHNSSTKRP